MRRFPRNPEVQSRGCGAVYSLSLSNKVTQQRLCEAGAPGLVLAALHHCMADPAVAISAADAVMSLACDNRRGQDMLGAGEGTTEALGPERGACELLTELVERCVRACVRALTD